MLITDNIAALLPTIQSRCVTLNLKPLDNSEIANYLTSHFKLEPERAKIAAGFCQGNMGKAIRFASSEDFQEMKYQVLNLLKSIDNMNVTDIVNTIKIFAQNKNNINDYLDLMLLWYRDVLMLKVTNNPNLLIYSQEIKWLREQSKTRSYENIETIIEAMETAKMRIRANVNFDTTVELMVLKIKDSKQ